jgi:hypothetical protein
MKINLHIERVVLDGVAVSSTDRPEFQARLKAELAQLLRAGGLSDELRNGATLTHLRAGVVQISNKNGPAKLGTDVARAVHQGLAHSGERRPESASRQASQGNRHVSPRGMR